MLRIVKLSIAYAETQLENRAKSQIRKKDAEVAHKKVRAPISTLRRHQICYKTFFKNLFRMQQRIAS